MSEKSSKTYWFRAKKYGWGWGLPLTWQGWLSFGLFIFVWLAALLTLLIVPEGSESIPVVNCVWFAVVMVPNVAALVYVSFKHGEPPKWRWGNKKK